MPTLPADVRASVLCALLALLVVSQIMGWLFARLGQPRVVGELIGGILLGTSGLGAVWPQAYDYLFSYSDASTWALTFVTWAGLALLLYASGLETLQGTESVLWKRVAWIVGLGTAVPLIVGYGLGRGLDLSRFYGAKGTPEAFGIFLGMSIAVTAIPVLSRILMDLGLMRTGFGRTVMTVALIEDLVLWAGLAVLLNFGTEAGDRPLVICLHVATTLGFFAVCYLWGHKALSLLARSPWLRGAPRGTLPVLCLLGTMLLGYLVGVRLIFGAFLAGRIVGRAFPAAREAAPGFAVPAAIFLASVGLRVDLRHGFELWAFVALMVLAIACKSLPAFVGARLAGIPAIGSLHLSIVLNARGALGIVLATLGLDAELIDAQAFSTLILMALATSMISGTWLQSVQRRAPGQLDLGDQPEVPSPEEQAKIPVPV